MKAKDLIKELEKCDPEAEVVMGNRAIHFVQQLPGYYDGSYDKLIIDESKKPYYSVTGMEFTRAGTKINLHELELSDLVWNCENEEEVNHLIIKIDDSISPDQKVRILAKIEEVKLKYLNYLKKERK